MWPDQIFTTDIVPRPIIISYRRISLLPLLRCRNYTKPTSVLSNQRQDSSISITAQPNLSPDAKSSPTFPTDAVDARIIYNQRRGSLKYFQLTPELLNRCTGSSRAVQHIGFWPSLTRTSEAMAIQPIQRLVAYFMIVWIVRHFPLK